MANTRKARAAPAPEKALRIRQRQRLIDACISALHQYGPSSTTIEKVVAIADMSPGIVNFYFDTKAAMLVAALEHLAVEFEREVLVPVGALREDPARALALLIDLYLDPELASPRKVSVWYAFWGEANSRREYHDICGKKDEGFATLVQDLIARLIVRTGQSGLDVDGVTLGLIGALEILWQNIAFQDEADVDRVAYKRRCRAFLRSVFPGYFVDQPAFDRAGLPRAPESLYADPGRFAIERNLILFPAWHVACLDGDMPNAGDYVAFEVAGERILVVRGEAGEVHAFRNACTARPHALGDGPAGHFDGGHIACGVDGRAYAYDGAAVNSGHGLTPLQTARSGGLIFVRLFDRDPPVPPTLAAFPEGVFAGLKLIAPADETQIAADWKLIAEFWLDSLFADGAVEAHPDGIACRGGADKARLFLFPDTLIAVDGDGASVTQVFGVAAGRSVVRRLAYGSRVEALDIARTVATCESTQAGLTAPLYDMGAESGGEGPAQHFRDWIASRLPKAAGFL